MIVYFADRKFNIKGLAATTLPEGFVIVDDNKSEDVETGVATFECVIAFDAKTRAEVEVCTEVGNYVLRKHDNKNEFYTIIDAEIDTKAQEVTIYAEDAGLDLLNEVVGPYAADKAYPIAHYIEKFAYDSGFVIGANEVSSLSRKLSWDGEATKTERIASIATQFGGCEIDYSFDIKGLQITNKYINIYRQRGQDVGLQLRLNKEVDSIVTTKTIANLATGLECVGGTPETESENEAQPITLAGYKYDDGDFYVSGTKLLSRKAVDKWSRYKWDKEPNKTTASGHIIRSFSYDTTSQSELCARAKTELASVCDMEVNYEVDIHDLDARIGDRVNIVDDAGGLYLSTRILKLETSVVNRTNTATLGEHLIKNDGIAQKLYDLAADFATTAQTVANAYKLAEKAEQAAADAQNKADNALEDANNALTNADNAQNAANSAQNSASIATDKADQAQAAVEVVEKNVSSLETTVNNAQAAADNAHLAAETAQQKAEDAKQAAENAKQAAETAATEAQNAQQKANSAEAKAETAVDTADEAKTQAAQAAQTAADAKADAKVAQEEIDALGEDLTTVSNTMQVDYARKTELTEATASLQTQIMQNADTISSHAKEITRIDETANNAAEQAAQAQSTAATAQTEADKATADAKAAQAAADEAATAAQTAQTEADKANEAATTAKTVANKAAADLAAAEEDLATVQGRVDATEEDILVAQQAVNEAKKAADDAQADATSATQTAVQAQSVADAARTNADNAQTAANEAKDKATLAQAAADKAQGDATVAQNKANEAAQAAATAQTTADTAVANAHTAQNKANEAAQVAAAAQTAADEADAKAAQAQTDLEAAEANLANVTSRVDATAEEVEAAKADVVIAQAAAETAKQEAAAAQSTADIAKANAQTAQTAAETAKTAADNAQTAATEAKKAADDAQAEVDALKIRVTDAETNIIQNAEEIELRAKKTEVTEALGGYYTKEETEAAIEVSASGILQTVSEVETTAINAADKAQGDADDALKRIASAETTIKQLSDSISMLVTDENGTTLFEQDSEGWSFNFANVLTELEKANDALTRMSENIGETPEGETVNKLIRDLEALMADVQSRTAYIDMGKDEQGNPQLELGLRDDVNGFKTVITNSSIEFKYGESVPMRLVVDANGVSYVAVDKIKVDEELQHGSFAWVIHGSGNYGLTRKGVS